MRIRPVLWFVATILTANVAAAQPQRIVSLNLCTDQLLLLLVEPDRIASLSYLAADPDQSWLAQRAAGIPTNHGQAEEVLAMAPDLILSGEFSAVLTSSLLVRLGHPVWRLGTAATADEAYAHVRQVAALTGEEAAGEQLVAAMLDAISAQQAMLLPLLRGKSAAFFSSNGFSYGSSTLQHDFLDTLGLRNIAAEAGLRGPAQLPLEALVAAQPDFLLVDDRGALDAQLAQPLLLHPALRALQHTRVLQMPDALFQCAGPRLAEAYRMMANQLENR